MTGRILVFISNKSDKKMVERWVKDETDYTLSPQSNPQTPENLDLTFDLCILDEDSFEQHKDWIRKVKELSSVLLPFLLLFPESQAKNFDKPRFADSAEVIRNTVDEIVATPLSKHELGIRIDNLLRMRKQSHEVETKEHYRELSERLKEREKTLDIIQSVNRTLIKKTDREELITSVAETIAKSQRFGCTFIALTRDRQTTYVCESESDYAPQKTSDLHSKDYINEVFDKGILVIEDVTQPPYKQHTSEREKHQGVALALRHNGQEFGVLTVHFPPDSPPTEKDKDLLKQVSDDLANSLDSIRERNLRNERETLIKILDRVLRHNMHNKMNVILGYSDFLKNQVSETERKKVSNIIQAGKKLVDITNKEREVINVITEEPEPEPIRIDKVTRDVVSELRDEYSGADIEYRSEEAEALALPQIRKSIEELTRNSVIHSEESRPKVEIKVRETDQTVQIRIADNNPRIPEEEIKVVTDKVIDPLYHGSGMGLWLVNWVIEKSNGELEFEQKEPRGNVVKAKIPRPGFVELS
ncbi:ATP-binding protein [Halorutilales archaeon Cl-col2-1]